ncbi:hypothetical protein EDB80DRAFT_110263 [Ilyonectria destructans]|nr:hypothetical protein EDB80DRAFT_110263 [Ilyonectria destructans]
MARRVARDCPMCTGNEECVFPIPPHRIQLWGMEFPSWSGWAVGSARVIAFLISDESRNASRKYSHVTVLADFPAGHFGKSCALDCRQPARKPAPTCFGMGGVVLLQGFDHSIRSSTEYTTQLISKRELNHTSITMMRSKRPLALSICGEKSQPPDPRIGSSSLPPTASHSPSSVQSRSRPCMLRTIRNILSARCIHNCYAHKKKGKKNPSPSYDLPECRLRSLSGGQMSVFARSYHRHLISLGRSPSRDPRRADAERAISRRGLFPLQ